MLQEATEGGPRRAEWTHGEKWSGPILKVEPQDFLMDWVWNVSERGGPDDHRLLAKQSNQKDETAIN